MANAEELHLRSEDPEGQSPLHKGNEVECPPVTGHGKVRWKVPIGKVRWYDKDRGFGFVSNPDGEDVYIGKNVLPKGVEELVTGQRLEYDYADGRPGPQALRIKVLDEGPRGARHRRGGAGGGAGARRQAKKHSPSDLNGMISDMISMLESTVQRDLRDGRYPERKDGHQMAEVLRAVARELDS